MSKIKKKKLIGYLTFAPIEFQGFVKGLVLGKKGFKVRLQGEQIVSVYNNKLNVVQILNYSDLEGRIFDQLVYGHSSGELPYKVIAGAQTRLLEETDG